MTELIAHADLLAAVTQIARIWYVVPLLIAINFVYGATRHERTADIIKISLHSLFWTGIVGVVILGIVILLGLWN